MAQGLKHTEGPVLKIKAPSLSYAPYIQFLFLESATLKSFLGILQRTY